jgi:hypothetical protein
MERVGRATWSVSLRGHGRPMSPYAAGYPAREPAARSVLFQVKSHEPRARLSARGVYGSKRLSRRRDTASRRCLKGLGPLDGG